MNHEVTLTFSMEGVEGSLVQRLRFLGGWRSHGLMVPDSWQDPQLYAGERCTNQSEMTLAMQDTKISECAFERSFPAEIQRTYYPPGCPGYVEPESVGEFPHASDEGP